MDNRTVINPSLQQSTPTAINVDVVAEYNRQNGIQDALLGEGTVICDKYVVENRLEVSSGEADLYLCDFNGEKYVAKLYRRKFAVKEGVVEALLKIDSPYVAKLYESGLYNGYPVEIIPYYENGSLQGKRFSEVELIETIIPDINEGLKALHSAGVIHKDLKPSNLMLNDDGKTVSIIDFGISSAIEGDQTVLITKTGMTPEYSAPETFRNIYYEGSDYYSFGITLFELCCGYTPYANMQQEEIEQYGSLQKIPFPAEMTPMFKDFLSALTYYDITNRKNLNNPNRRWTYDEVKRWLDGDDMQINRCWRKREEAIMPKTKKEKSNTGRPRKADDKVLLDIVNQYYFVECRNQPEMMNQHGLYTTLAEYAHKLAVAEVKEYDFRRNTAVRKLIEELRKKMASVRNLRLPALPIHLLT